LGEDPNFLGAALGLPRLAFVCFAADNMLKPSPQPPQNFGACKEYIFSAAKQTNANLGSPKAAPRKLGSSPKRSRPMSSEDFDPDGVDIFEVPDISNFSYSIEQDNNKMNLKDLIPLDEFENFQEEAPKPKKRGRPRKS
jgi:hypothetical protein